METVVEVIAAAKSVALTDGWTGDERGDVQGDGRFNGDHGDDGVTGGDGVRGTRAPMAMSISGRCNIPFNGCAKTATDCTRKP